LKRAATDEKPVGVCSIKRRAARIIGDIHARLAYWKALYNHPHTPRLARVLLWLALAYLVSPIDIIPDCIPILGHLDDLLIVPTLIFIAIHLIPKQVRDECAAALSADKKSPTDSPGLK